VGRNASQVLGHCIYGVYSHRDGDLQDDLVTTGRTRLACAMEYLLLFARESLLWSMHIDSHNRYCRRIGANMVPDPACSRALSPENIESLSNQHDLCHCDDQVQHLVYSTRCSRAVIVSVGRLIYWRALFIIASSAFRCLEDVHFAVVLNKIICI